MNPFESLQNQWTVLIQQITQLTDRVTELENRLDMLAARQQPFAVRSPQAPVPDAPVTAPPAPQAPAPEASVAAPPGWPAGGLGVPSAPQTAPAPEVSATPPQAAPGPQAVPSFQQLQERMLQLSQAKGDKACIDLIVSHGGKDEQGTVKISLVPQERYAALFADIGSQLGLH